MRIPSAVLRRSGLLAAVTLLTVACSETTAPAPGAIRSRVDAGGYQIELERWTGTGPTVVLIAGLGEPMTTWRDLPSRIRDVAAVVRYDRGGVGTSADAPDQRTADDVARELRMALESAGVPGPYVLVAHSVGGLHMQRFAQRYPSLVAGLVFVDATPHQPILGLAAAVPPDQLAAILRQGADDLQLTRGSRKEFLAQVQTAQQVEGGGRLPDVPTYVLSSLKVGPGETAEAKQEAFELHRQWVAQMTNGIHVGVPDAGHHIHWDKPDAVLNAIRHVVMAAR